MAPAQVVRAGASITGARWSLKGRPDVLKPTFRTEGLMWVNFYR
jgi:hypothetical protein